MDKTENKDKSIIKKKHPILKMFLFIIIIYLVIALYKFIALTLINDIGQSFYEESYSITEKVESYDNSVSITPDVTERYIIKIKNRLIERIYDRNGRADNPFDITYVEIEKKQASNFHLDQEKQKYIVSDRLAGLSDEEKAEYFEDINSCKSFKDIAAIDYSFGGKLAVALNPLTFVNGVNNTIYIAIPFESTIKMKFNNDFLLTETIIKQWGTDKKVVCNISYDYVPDHFTNMKIQNPFGTYKNQFEYDENYWK